MESLPLFYSLSSICSCSLRGIMDHTADCWPLHRGNSETAGHPSQGQTDAQVTWRGSECKRVKRQGGRRREDGGRGDVEERDPAGWWKPKKWIDTFRQELRDFISKPLSACEVGQCFLLSLGHRSVFRLPYWFIHESMCCRSNAFDLLIIFA